MSRISLDPVSLLFETNEMPLNKAFISLSEVLGGRSGGIKASNIMLNLIMS